MKKCRFPVSLGAKKLELIVAVITADTDKGRSYTNDDRI